MIQWSNLVRICVKGTAWPLRIKRRRPAKMLSRLHKKAVLVYEVETS